MYDCVQRTADVELLRELWPHVVRALNSPQWRPGPHGLLDTGDRRVWFDWGMTEEMAFGEDCLSDAEFLAPAHLELYFHFWALEMLYQRGRVALAEHVMRRTWGLIKNAGAWSLWETWLRTSQENQQKCQGWGAAPLIAMARRILGVRPEPGRPEEVLIAPTAAALSFARGAVAHPAGPIEVDWRLHEGEEGRWLELAACVPEGLEVRVAPEGPLAGIPARVALRRREQSQPAGPTSSA